MRRKGVSVQKRITHALVELMKEKAYDRITITDITTRADVSRMAYYRHYSSKEDILVKYMDGLNASICDRMQGLEGKDRLRGYFIILFELLQKNKDFGTAVLDAHLEELVLYILNRQMRQTFGKECAAEGDYYRIAFIAGAFHNLLMEWIRGGCVESAKEITDVGCKMLSEEILVLN